MKSRVDPRIAGLSLAVAWILWVVVQKQERIPNTYQGVRLAYQLPSDVVLTGDHPLQVSVAVRASRQKLKELQESELVVTVDNREGLIGQQLVVLDPKDVERPFGVDVESVRPAVFTVTYDRKLTRSVPVEVTLQGEVHEDYEVDADAIAVEPATVKVTGPATLVGELDSIHTAPVDITGKKKTVTAKVLTVQSPHADITLDNPAVVAQATIPINPKIVRRRFEAVPVRVLPGRWRFIGPNPSALAASVEGPAPQLNALTATDIVLSVDVSTLEPQPDDYGLDVVGTVTPETCAECRVTGLTPQAWVDVKVLRTPREEARSRHAPSTEVPADSPDGTASGGDEPRGG